MSNETEIEMREIQERIAAAWDSATIDMMDKLIDHLRAIGIDVPTIQELAKSAVSGNFNDPAFEHALADYTHPQSEVIRVRQQAHRKMLEDLRNHQNLTR